MKIGVVGAGRIGGGLARQLAAAGHELLLYSRTSGRLQSLAAEFGDRVSVGDVHDAATFGDVLILSVPWPNVPEVLKEAGPLDGKVVIDTTNHFERGALARLGHGKTAARVNADRMPGAAVVKAFNTLTAAFQAAEAGRAGDRVVLFFCGDDAQAKALVGGLIEDAGFEPCDLGGLDDAAPMEAPRRPGAVYGEEYRHADAQAARRALAAKQPLPPVPTYD
jgi:hypothetical protein